MKIELLSKTSVDWKRFLIKGKEILGRNISQNLDKQRKQVSDDLAYLLLLAEFKNENSNPQESQYNPGSILKHFSLSFLVYGLDQNSILKILADSDFSFTDVLGADQQHCILISGTLEQYRSSIINYLSSDSSYFIRKFFTLMIVEFDSLGLTPLFLNYSRKQNPDQTMKLEFK